MKHSAVIMCIVLGVLFLTYGVALSETKQLICKNTLTQEYMDGFDDSYQEMCEKYKDRNYCEDAKKERADMKVCKNSGLSYSHKKTFIFETSSLNNKNGSSAEGYTETCWGAKTPISSYSIKTTPSFITFSSHDNNFNINRESLQGGYDTKKDFECTVSTYVKKNKI